MAFKKLKYWFDQDLAKLLSDKICQIKPNFNQSDFIKSVEQKVENLELKDRVEIIADLLFENLEESYVIGIETLLQILGPENEEETGMFSNYYWVMPIAKFVEKYGLNSFDLSMNAIKEITKRNTGEYTIRPFIEKDQTKTLGVMINWSKNENKHVRRLSCEGVRPRLPWAKKLDIFIENPNPILPILSNLKDDKSKYVQKSVANCINDILKDNFEIGKDLIDSWDTKNTSKERKWIIKHALRNLFKKENAWARGKI